MIVSHISWGCQFMADTVAKVENRSAPKISRKLIFGCLRDCVSFRRRWEDPWSILDETIWSPTSPHARCISGSKNFRSSPQKDFCNNIGTFETYGLGQAMSEFRLTDIRGVRRHIANVPTGDSCTAANWHSVSRHTLLFAVPLQPTVSALVREAEYQCNSSHQNEADGPRHI